VGVSTATLDRPPAAASNNKAPRVRVSDRIRAERRLGLLLSTPAVVIMLAVTAYPLGNAFYLSLFNYRLTSPDAKKFVWFGNYWTVLQDKLFWEDVLTTAVITVITVIVELVIGLAFALVMHKVIFGRRTIRTAILVPYGIVTVVSGFAFRYAFQNDSGFVNQWFGWLGFGNDFAWFSHTWSSFFVIILSEVWKTTPFISLLLLAGLAQVPEDISEAASVDGATAWQRLFRVILPNMKAAILVAVLFRSLDAWRLFDNVFIMTGGQQHTETLSFLTYRQAVTRTELGLGDAIGVLLFITVMIIAAGFILLSRVDLSEARGER
jgi:multiple sugar transport system permease protein